MNLESTIQLFKLLGDVTRMKIILSLQQTEKNGREIATELKIEQSNLSHQMRNLLEANVIVSRKEGRFIFYSISPEFETVLTNITKEISNPKLFSQSVPNNPRHILIKHQKTHE